jgi:hypothetical protein
MVRRRNSLIVRKRQKNRQHTKFKEKVRTETVWGRWGVVRGSYDASVKREDLLRLLTVLELDRTTM